MDRARDLERTGDVQQGSGHFRLCDGHDRGTLRVIYCVSSFDLLTLSNDTDIHWSGSVQ